MQCLPSVSSGSAQGFRDKWLGNNFNVFSPANVHLSIFPETEESTDSKVNHTGFLGLARLLDLSPGEVGFLARSTALERLLFTLSRQEDVYSFIEDQICESDDPRLRSVSRLLFCPLKSKLASLRKKLATGPSISPFEALVTSYEERFLDNTALLRSANTFIPAVRAPQVSCTLCIFVLFLSVF